MSPAPRSVQLTVDVHHGAGLASSLEHIEEVLMGVGGGEAAATTSIPMSSERGHDSHYRRAPPSFSQSHLADVLSTGQSPTTNGLRTGCASPVWAHDCKHLAEQLLTVPVAYTSDLVSLDHSYAEAVQAARASDDEGREDEEEECEATGWHPRPAAAPTLDASSADSSSFAPPWAE